MLLFCFCVLPVSAQGARCCSIGESWGKNEYIAAHRGWDLACRCRGVGASSRYTRADAGPVALPLRRAALLCLVLAECARARLLYNAASPARGREQRTLGFAILLKRKVECAVLRDTERCQSTGFFRNCPNGHRSAHDQWLCSHPEKQVEDNAR